MTSMGVARISRLGWLGLLGALCPLPLGCTIKQVDNPVESGGTGGGGTTGAGGTSGAGAVATTGGNSSLGGSGGSVAVSCGDITDKGVCQGSEVVYCKNSQLARLDCSKAGDQCQIKDGQATCVALDRAPACGSLTTLGTCDGQTIRYCDKSGLTEAAKEINCAAYGQICDPTGATDGGAICVPQGLCPSGQTEKGTCSGNSLSFCENSDKGVSELYTFDCGVDECRTVGGFSDCFLPGVADGCGVETAAGRCDGQTRVACMGGVVAREDCAALGLKCQTDVLNTACVAGDCPASCPVGWACSATSGGRCQPTASPTRDWTVMVYVVGDNNLADAAWVDLNEMEDAPDSARVQTVAEFELSSTYSSLAPRGYQTGVYRMPISHDEDADNVTSVSDSESLGALNMSDPKRLSEFVQWAAATYPAKHQALILWDHGMGWRGGFVDTGSKGQMTLRNIVDGVRNSGVHLDVLGFDACLMGMHEVGLSVRGLADVLVSSEEVIPGGGYPYDTVLGQLVNRPSMVATDLGSTIVKEYTDYYSGGTRARDVTLSSIDLAQMSSVNQQLSDFAGRVSADLSGHRTEVQSALRAETTLRFTDPDSADLSGMLTSFQDVTGDIGTAAGDFKTWFSGSKAVLSSGTTGNMAAAKGLALYLPENASSQYNTGTFEDYRSSTSFLPIQPWHALMARLTQEQDSADPKPAPEGAVDTFGVTLSWAKTPDGTTSGVDLDLYVYEPNGDFATPSNGSVSGNGLLSADSYDTDISRESYELQADHQSGTYIVLVHYYGGPTGEQAYPRIQLYEKELPGGSRTLLRASVVNRELVEIPMDASKPLTTTIDSQNVQKVLNLEYSNLWWALTVQVK